MVEAGTPEGPDWGTVTLGSHSGGLCTLGETLASPLFPGSGRLPWILAPGLLAPNSLVSPVALYRAGEGTHRCPQKPSLGSGALQ